MSFIEAFIYEKAAPEQILPLNRFFNQLRKEQLPDDPPVPAEETAKNLNSLPDFVKFLIHVIWDPQRTNIIAESNIAILDTGDNKHLAQFEISVLPEYRRQGLGKALLREVAGIAQIENRRLLMTSTNDRQPGGEAFMVRIGAQKGLEAHTNQLKIEELDRGQLAAWLEMGSANRDEFEIGFWDGPYPEEEINNICKLFDLTNQQPFGELEIEDMHMSADQLRQMETNLFARGSQRWTCYVKHCASGEFAGYTETVWNPNRPEILRQDMTGVFPEYRSKGLGRWLKAAMLQRVLTERPVVKYVRTGNADSNAAMLKINNQLGFRPYYSDALWQVELAAVLNYLQQKGH